MEVPLSGRSPAAASGRLQPVEGKYDLTLAAGSNRYLTLGEQDYWVRVGRPHVGVLRKLQITGLDAVS